MPSFMFYQRTRKGAWKTLRFRVRPRPADIVERGAVTNGPLRMLPDDLTEEEEASLDASNYVPPDASEEQLAELARIAELRAGVLARAPFLTVPAVDFDVARELKRKPGTAELVDAAIAPFRARLAGLGIYSETWLSSGIMDGGRHLEFGPLEEARVDAVQRMHALVKREAKLLGWDVDGGVICPHPDHPGISLDLSTLHHHPATRGGMVATKGAIHKDGAHRKTKHPESARFAPGPIPASVLAAVELPAVRATKKRRGQKRHAALVAPPREWENLAEQVAQLYRAGANHELRLALAGGLGLSGMIDPRDGEALVAAGLRDAGDGRGSYASTMGRIRTGQGVTSWPKVRQLRGGRALFDLARAADLDMAGARSRLPLAEILHRFGAAVRPSKGVAIGASDAYNRLADASEEAAWGASAAEAEELRRKAEVARRSARRAASSSYCGQIEQRMIGCCGCGLPGTWNPRLCGIRGLCGVCELTLARNKIQAAAWIEQAYVIGVWRYASKAGAEGLLREVAGDKDAKDGIGDLPLGFLSPARDGAWEVTLVGSVATCKRVVWAKSVDHEEALVRIDTDADKHAAESAALAANFAWHVAMRDLADRGLFDDFARLATELHGRTAVRVRKGSLTWPTKEEAIAAGKDAAREAESAERAESSEEPTTCPGCPPDLARPWENGFESRDADSLEVLVPFASRPLQLHEIVEASEGKPIKGVPYFARQEASRRHAERVGATVALE